MGTVLRRLGLALALGWAVVASARPIPPAPTRWVTDQAGFLSPQTVQRLDRRLEAYQQKTGHQVLVWVGRSTGGVPIEDFAVRAFEAWGVGRKGEDDGLVLFIFPEDRTMRIEVGYGLEDEVPDAIAARVIREVLQPGFRAGRQDEAVIRAVEVLLSAIEGQPAGELFPARTPERPHPAQLGLFAMLAVLALLLFITNPHLAMGLLWVLAAGGHRRSGFGGGFGGGLFRGGGGRSGGGGASGSW